MKPLDPIRPTIIIVFGITGDLARRKLIPALFDLHSKGLLPERLKIIGFSRRDFTPEMFTDFVRTVLVEHPRAYTTDQIEAFVSVCTYCAGLFDDADAYGRLSAMIYHIEKEEFDECANKLHYLATPPNFYETIFHKLADSGLTIPCGGEDGWSRVLVEKPFGRNTKTAIALDELLGKLFKEEQIFRIDHYLAKEAVQNIVMFRFSNSIFEPVWNRDYIERVEIRLFEKRGVGTRGAFFESVGALRDVGQNHLLQMLAVVAMEHPLAFGAEHIRTERARVLAKVRLFPDTKPVRAQYGGYGQEVVSREVSNIETYFRLEAEVKSKRWRNVPFVLESGKALAEDVSEIVVHFKHPEVCLAESPFGAGSGAGAEINDNEHEPEGRACPHTNVLTFRIQPNEGISVRFWITKPGLTNELAAKELSFSYGASPEAVRLPDAYERLLYDALMGDQTLFTSTEEVRAAWKFVTPILRAWNKNKTPLLQYESGSNGPEMLE